MYVSDSGSAGGHQPTEEELAQALAALVGLGIIAAAFAAAAASDVKRWWHDVAIPALKLAGDNALLTMTSNWSKFTGTRKVDRWSAPAEMGPSTEPTPAACSTELEVVLQDFQARMGSAEARERFVKALLARAFSEAQMKMLRKAKIEEDGDPFGVTAAMESLTPGQVGEAITVMIERNPSLLDRASLAELGAILGGAEPMASMCG